MENFNFKKDGLHIVKKAIEKDLATFLYNYILVKKQVAQTLFKTRYISPYEDMFGHWSDPQVPNTYANYADIAMETLLLKLQPLMEQITEKKLYPNYSFVRVYKKGDVLERHKDRMSCEISTTLHLGGDPWPIYIEPDPKKCGTFDMTKKPGEQFVSQNTKGVAVELDPGDMLIYRGNILEHWREALKGEHCAQVFLHYNDVNFKNAKNRMYDSRLHLGLPESFQKIKDE